MTEFDFRRGRLGAVIRPRSKTRITIYLDDDVLERIRERADRAGQGYQTLINQALRYYLEEVEPPRDPAADLREERQRIGRDPGPRER